MTSLDTDVALQLLRHGNIAVEGRLVEASNATLFCKIDLAGTEARCVYKPVAGERPLWDFPDGTLAAREVAAYTVSEATGLHVVPPTVMREGPFGPGMCQLWVDTDGTELVDVTSPAQVPAGWLQVLDALGSDGEPVVLAHADDERLRRMALLDVVLNNADRKGGHVLVQADSVLGVDHGVSFHPHPKLRTVLWGWAGQRLRDDEMEMLGRLCADLDGSLGTELSGWITRPELSATRRRSERLRHEALLPYPSDGWPAIPWPPF